MATKTQIAQTLKELNLTEGQMDILFEESAEYNPMSKALITQGLDWRGLNTVAIKQIPTLKGKHLERQQKKAEEEAILAEQKRKEGEVKTLDTRSDEQKLIDRIVSNEKLDEMELEDLLDYEISSEDFDERRWSIAVASIIKLEDRYFQLNWDRGKTENQEDGFYYQPFEVEKLEFEKTITITEWIRKDCKNDNRTVRVKREECNLLCCTNK